MVADEARIEVVKEGVGAEIEGDAEDRHIVGVHHAVAEAVGLPARDQRGGALEHRAEERMERLGMFQQLGKVRLDDVLQQLLQFGMLAGVVEEFEVAEAHMAGGQAQQHGTAFRALTVDQ